MKEKELLRSIFGKGKLWRGKYTVDWCDRCDCAVVICPVCHLQSCSGGGCPECQQDIEDFLKNSKHRIEDYLTPKEIAAYNKAKVIQKFILETIADSDSIDFERLKRDGEMSDMDEEMLKTKLI